MTTKKNKSKGCLLPIVFLLVCFLLWFNFVSINMDKENHFRVFIMVTLKERIQEYHRLHHVYPLDLQVLELKDNPYIAEYIHSGVFSYSRDPSVKEWYRLTCRFTGFIPMKIGDGVHNVSWSGIQYSNSREQLEMMAGSDKPDKNGFYPIDFH